MTAPRVSIVIVTKNGAATLPGVLDAIRRQRTTFAVEVVAVDSGSTDGTQELLASRVEQLITIRADAFNHGLTRNLGVERAGGEFVVLLVQDAVPASDDWLTTLTAPLFGDPRVAGTFARQQARPDCGAITRHYLERWIAAGTAGFTSEVSGRAAFDALAPQDRFRLCVFDNVCSCIRRSVWRDHPFKATTIAEDLEWARDVLIAGHQLQFVPDAVVTHSHDRPARYEYARTRALHHQLARLFDLQTIPTIPLLLRSIATTLPLHLWCERTHPSQWPRAAALALAWPLGQYLGARDNGRASSVVRPGLV